MTKLYFFYRNIKQDSCQFYFYRIFFKKISKIPEKTTKTPPQFPADSVFIKRRSDHFFSILRILI